MRVLKKKGISIYTRDINTFITWNSQFLIMVAENRRASG